MRFNSEISSLGAHYSEFPNSCLGTQFTFAINAFQVFIDRRHRDLEQLADLRLRKPHRAAIQTHFNARPVVLGLIENQLGRVGSVLVVHQIFAIALSVFIPLLRHWGKRKTAN